MGMPKEKDTRVNLVGFSDILLDRRCTSDLMWASRAWNPVSAYVQPHKSSATKIKSTVLHSYRLRQVINEVSRREKEAYFFRSKTTLMKKFFNFFLFRSARRKASKPKSCT